MTDHDQTVYGNYWDDVELYQTQRSRCITIEAEDIIAFARTFDPLPIHADPQAAADGPFGVVTASGSHMLAIRNLLCHDFAFSAGVIVAIGLDEVRYLAPLLAGQVCQLEVEPIDKTPSRSKLDRGVLRVRMTLLADGKPVLNMVDNIIVRRRPGA